MAARYKRVLAARPMIAVVNLWRSQGMIGNTGRVNIGPVGAGVGRRSPGEGPGPPKGPYGGATTLGSLSLYSSSPSTSSHGKNGFVEAMSFSSHSGPSQ